RSALMFTFIVLGENMARRSSIYNTLSASAFLLLIYNPFWLWDVGFQLSYLAVLSIVIFMKPIYNLIYVKHKILDHVWKLLAVTLAAQILTTSITIYYFNQFPLLFLFTNIVAVPVSSLILLVEIALCATATIPAIASQLGWVTYQLISGLNFYIESISRLPFALWSPLSINFAQTILLYLVIAGFSLWLFTSSKRSLASALACTVAFLSIRSYAIIQTASQKKIIVYNASGHHAVDFIQGNHFSFLSDSILAQDNNLMSFHLRASRIRDRIFQSIPNLYIRRKNLLIFNGIRILLVDGQLSLPQQIQAQSIDLVIVLAKSSAPPERVIEMTGCKQVVIASSYPSFLINIWQQACSSANVRMHINYANGAFAINIP
ncbi:MAG: ComEC/Rec2 family competence protein, partial [Chitinophagaceae bacterium]|nr:ComEC/Rec2 family competence protein [Chitinophagaceae bacterium]